jgi:hypothetical protein
MTTKSRADDRRVGQGVRATIQASYCMNANLERVPVYGSDVVVGKKVEPLSPNQVSLRIGAICAVLGAIVSILSGIGFGNLTNESVIDSVLSYIASQPRWYWPLVHLGFMLGAVLWVGAFSALSNSLREGVSWALGRLAVAAVILGAAIHVVDSSISGYGLAALADAWANAPATDRVNIVSESDMLLRILSGTWATVICLFHGLPFAILGAALINSGRYPSWLGLTGLVGGVGSLVSGAAIFLGTEKLPERLYIPFALVISLFMLLVGIYMWRLAADSTTAAQSESG